MERPKKQPRLRTWRGYAGASFSMRATNSIELKCFIYCIVSDTRLCNILYLMQEGQVCQDLFETAVDRELFWVSELSVSIH